MIISSWYIFDINDFTENKLIVYNFPKYYRYSVLKAYQIIKVTRCS